MKKLTLILTVILSLSGCAIAPKVDAVRTAVDRSAFKGLDKNSKFSISFPSSHSGRYDSIDQLNFKIEGGKYKGNNASALVVKSKDSKVWEVLMVMVEENGKWVNLPKTD